MDVIHINNEEDLNKVFDGVAEGRSFDEIRQSVDRLHHDPEDRLCIHGYWIGDDDTICAEIEAAGECVTHDPSEAEMAAYDEKIAQVCP